MFRKILCAGAAAATLGVMSAPAHADNITTGTWYAFGFTTTGGALGAGFAAGTSPNGVLAPSAPWTITLSAPARLTVTDVEASGDQFTLYDNGQLLGTTSTPVLFGNFVGECISCALSDGTDFSHGSFTLSAGVNVITGVYDGATATPGDGDFEVTGVPEPASWALILIGVSGLGVALRSRRKAAAALA
jgi:hypothetical protein